MSNSSNNKVEINGTLMDIDFFNENSKARELDIT